LVGKGEGTRPLGKPKHKWNDNIRRDLRNRSEICELDSSGSEWGPVVSFFEHGNEPSGSMKGGEFID
jgi:hypothetical protein